jgi:hypothetical protein
VTVRERAELWPAEQVRAHVGAQPGELLVYVSAGGGGDPQAEEQLHRTCAALLAEPEVRIVVGAGPLYRGLPLLRDRVVWLQQTGVAELMAGFDLAVCAAGYNSFYELMHAGVPTLFLPQAKVADEQDRRAERACQAGAAFRLGRAAGSSAASDFASELRSLLARMRDPEQREAARTAARALCPRNHAREAAAELLRVVLPGHQVEAAVEAVNDSLLVALRTDAVQFEQVVELMHALRPEAAGAAAGRPEQLAGQAEESLELLRYARRHQLPLPALLRGVRLLGPKLGSGTTAERAAGLRTVLEALQPFADWPAALSLIKLLVTERRQKTAEAAGEIVRFLSALQARGDNLLRGIGYLSLAHGTEGTYPGNRELLEAAQAHLSAPPAAAPALSVPPADAPAGSS